jgi:hypothetical protein
LPYAISGNDAVLQMTEWQRTKHTVYNSPINTTKHLTLLCQKLTSHNLNIKILSPYFLYVSLLKPNSNHASLEDSHAAKNIVSPSSNSSAQHDIERHL